jgi:phospholipid/cholesterol/gamma-HCH transport system substrate-binding protein
VRRAIKTYGRFVAVIIGFAVLAAFVGGYIVVHQRLQLPFQNRYTIKAEFPTSEALVPGLGQPANVAGVKVGQITAATLRNGRSVVTMTIDPHQLPRIYANATAHLFANTPLQDMEINIAPGGPPAAPLKPGSIIPLGQTQVPIQSDELLHALDADTRDYFTSLVAGVAGGLHGRGMDLRMLLRGLGPTSRQVRELSNALASRRVQLARLVHNLSVLAVAASKKDTQLGQVVSAGSATLQTLSTQDTALAKSLSLLPGTLTAATRTLGHATSFAQQLGPTLQALQPTAQGLERSLRSAGRLVNATEPVLRTRVRPFITAAKPVISNLLPTTTDLTTATPDLSNVAQVLEYLANELLYVPGGGAHSYLFWLSWFAHDANSNTSTTDAYGSGIRGVFQLSCSSISAQPALQPLVQLFAGVKGCT